MSATLSDEYALIQAGASGIWNDEAAKVGVNVYLEYLEPLAIACQKAINTNVFAAEMDLIQSAQTLDNLKILLDQASAFTGPASCNTAGGGTTSSTSTSAENASISNNANPSNNTSGGYGGPV